MLRAHSPAVSAAIRAEDDAVRDLPESEWLRREAAEARAHKPPRPLSAEHKQKISAAQKGRAVNGPLMTLDHKARLTAALRRYAPESHSCASAGCNISRYALDACQPGAQGEALGWGRRPHQHLQPLRRVWAQRADVQAAATATRVTPRAAAARCL